MLLPPFLTQSLKNHDSYNNQKESPMKQRILIAGIGSGSLGFELLKCLSLSDDYEIFGADISKDAYGHSDSRFRATTVLQNATADLYANQLLAYAVDIGADVIAPGAEATHKIISDYRDIYSAASIDLMVNSKQVIDLCSDKVACNDFLSSKGFKTAKTVIVDDKAQLENFDCYPCVIKPARNSGGSNMVFLAENAAEAGFFVDYLKVRGFDACVQEYIDSEKEFTVGVLSSRNGEVISSIALMRNLAAKLSMAMSYGDRVISSGWSQGRIDYFPEVCSQAEKMAASIGSSWALNIQGRLRNGVFIPFEINPRHSGTSYMRALAGVNEPLIGLMSIRGKVDFRPAQLKVGQYLRVLNEYYVAEDAK